MEIKKVLVMGAGTMGTGVAQAVASAGLPVYLVDQTEELIARARTLVKNGIDLMEKEGLYTAEQVSNAVNNITYVTADRLGEIGGEVDMVVESVFENRDVKRSVFAQLDQACRPDCIFCSNTSASNVFEFVEVTNPERFLITHWFNPPYLMKLVEVVKGPNTTDEIAKTTMDFLTSIGRKPCLINQYIPGFIVNRIANAISREAGYMIMNGWTTGADIDAALRATSGIRYAFEGPMALFDVVGWDLIRQGCLDVYPSLCTDTDTCAYAEELVKQNRLGVKTGGGVFDYEGVDMAEFMAARSEKIIKMYKAVEDLGL